MHPLITEFLSDNPKCTIKKLLTFLEDNFKIIHKDEINASTPVRGMFQNIRDPKAIHTIFPDRSEPNDLTRQRELKRGFKIRTEGESSNADSKPKKK